MITAKKRTDKYYPDIEMDKEYEVDYVGDYVFLKGNKRHYKPKYFQLYRNGNKITVEQAKAYMILESW